MSSTSDKNQNIEDSLNKQKQKNTTKNSEKNQKSEIDFQE